MALSQDTKNALAYGGIIAATFGAAAVIVLNPAPPAQANTAADQAFSQSCRDVANGLKPADSVTALSCYTPNGFSLRGY